MTDATAQNVIEQVYELYGKFWPSGTTIIPSATGHFPMVFSPTGPPGFSNTDYQKLRDAQMELWANLEVKPDTKEGVSKWFFSPDLKAQLSAHDDFRKHLDGLRAGKKRELDSAKEWLARMDKEAECHKRVKLPSERDEVHDVSSGEVVRAIHKERYDAKKFYRKGRVLRCVRCHWEVGSGEKGDHGPRFCALESPPPPDWC